MPFLATSRLGVESYLTIGAPGVALWLSAQVLSADEVAILRGCGKDVTVFTYEIASPEAVSRAIATIKQHYPNETVWSEQTDLPRSLSSADIAQAFLNREPIVSVKFFHNAYVRVADGEHQGECGSLVTVLSLLPEPTYVVELESGHDANVLQSAVERADA